MKMTATAIRGMWKATALSVVALAGAGSITGCRGERSAERPRQFLPDMDDSPKWKPQAASAFFEDGRTMRPKVAGTVAFGESDREDDHARARYLREDDGYYSGISGYDASGAPVFLDSIPLDGLEGWPREAGEGEPSTDFLARREAFMGELIQRGQERFNIYCSVCHGYAGDGQGMVGQRWAAPVANFHDPKYVDTSIPQGKDGYIFNVIQHGVPFPNVNNEPLRMPAYGHAVNERDSWAIIAYLRVLQATRTNIENVPPAVRERLHSTPKPAPKGQPEGDEPAAPQSPATPPINVPTQAPSQGGDSK